MKKLILITLLFTTLFSCKKEDTRPDCEQNKTGSINVINSTNNPYSFYYNTKFQRIINPNSNVVFILPVGSYDLYSEQQDGYILYPSEVDGSLYLDQCAIRTFTID